MTPRPARGRLGRTVSRRVNRTLSRFLGVDFSGARDAGRAIWIARGEARAGRLVIRECHPVSDLAGGRTDRASAHRALVECLAQAGPCAVGLDFPFSVPAQVAHSPGWIRFLLRFPRRFPAPDDFRRLTRVEFGELRRATDREARAPMAVNNLRLYRQTYHGLRDVLLPLVRRKAVRVLPLQRPAPGVPWLLETCPASALIAHGRRRPYKGRGRLARAGRRAILAWLEGVQGLAFGSRALRRRVLDQTGGDALDSVIAAWIAWRAVTRGEPLVARGALERIEGHIYHGGDAAAHRAGRAGAGPRVLEH